MHNDIKLNKIFDIKIIKVLSYYREMGFFLVKGQNI